MYKEDEEQIIIESSNSQCSISLIHTENVVGILLKSEMGTIEIGTGTEKSPFINIQGSRTDSPFISFSIDEISEQPLIRIKDNDGANYLIPLDKAAKSFMGSLKKMMGG